MTPALTSALMTDMTALAPEILLALGTMALMIIGAYGRGGSFRPVVTLSILLWTAVGALMWLKSGVAETRVFNDMLILDQLARLAKTLILFGSAASLLVAVSDLRGTIMARFEYPVLMGFSTLGMFLMVSANDLLSLYVGLELSSLALYVMAAFNRNDSESSEAGLKYFVLGAISSGLLLFGSSLIYGYTGSLQFDVISATLGAAAVPGPTPVIVVFGMALIIAAMTFKIAAVPFHMWTPDVYEGAPTTVTAFFAIVPKFAALILLARILTGPFEGLARDWIPIIGLLSLASMLVGAFAAIVQKSIKRLLAYSSIGNIGYVLIGLAAHSHFGLSSVIVYMCIYMATTAGTFGMILLLRRDGHGVKMISDLAGISKTHPVIAYGLALMMFSMSGIPPLAGFFAKLAIFQAAVSAQMYVLAVVGVLTSVVAAWYYLNIIRVMFFENAADDARPVTMAWSVPALLVVGLSLGFVILYVLMPGPLSVVAANATSGLLSLP